MITNHLHSAAYLLSSVCADSAREALADLDVAGILTFQLKRAPDAERRHIILEILGSLGESGKMGRRLQYRRRGNL